MTKQIAIDKHSWELLCQAKAKLALDGRTPSLSDAIRYLASNKIAEEYTWYWRCGNCGKILLCSEHRKIPLEPKQPCKECGKIAVFKNVTEEKLRETVRSSPKIDFR